MIRPRLLHPLVCAAGAIGAIASGCAQKHGRSGDRSADRPDGAAVDVEGWTPDRDTSLPVVARVHPLTRIVKRPTGEVTLLCQLELRDAFGQVTRTLGVVDAELRRARARNESQSPDPTVKPERVWQIDLRDPKVNAAAFDDLITRSYTLNLGDLPTELAALGEPSAPSEPGSVQRFVLRVTFRFKDSADQTHAVSAVYELPPR